MLERDNKECNNTLPLDMGERVQTRVFNFLTFSPDSFFFSENYVVLI